jgi:hypothetical protein
MYIIDIGILLNKSERALCKNLRGEVCFVMAQFIAKIWLVEFRKFAILLLKLEQNGGFLVF